MWKCPKNRLDFTIDGANVGTAMQCFVESVPILASQFGGWEIVLILAIILILFGAKRLPEIARGMGEGMRALDDEAIEAGKSVGGIYGKPAAEALTADNQTAEVYDPAVFQGKQRGGNAEKNGKGSWLRRLWRRVWHYVCKLLGQEAK